MHPPGIPPPTCAATQSLTGSIPTLGTDIQTLLGTAVQSLMGPLTTTTHTKGLGLAAAQVATRRIQGLGRMTPTDIQGQDPVAAEAPTQKLPGLGMAIAGRRTQRGMAGQSSTGRQTTGRVSGTERGGALMAHPLFGVRTRGCIISIIIMQRVPPVCTCPRL